MTGRAAPAVLWPPERLHWALLDPKALGRASVRPRERGYLFEDVLPCPIEEVAAAYAELKDGRVVACGAERSALAEAAEVRGAISLVPERLPDWMPDEVRAATDPMALELLAGDLEPAAVRRARRQFVLSAAAIVVLGLALAAWGVLARGAALARASGEAEARRAGIVLAATAGSVGIGHLPPELRLAAELRGLERTRAAAVPAPADVAPVLAAALALWPDGADLVPESVAVDGRSIVVRGRAADAGQMQRLADALAGLPGWRLAPPEFRAAREGVDFTIALSPAPPAAPATPPASAPGPEGRTP